MRRISNPQSPYKTKVTDGESVACNIYHMLFQKIEVVLLALCQICATIAGYSVVTICFGTDVAQKKGMLS